MDYMIWYDIYYMIWYDIILWIIIKIVINLISFGTSVALMLEWTVRNEFVSKCNLLL